MKLFLLLLCTATSLWGKFIPPAEKAQLFRRDSLALDANRQRLLAQDLLLVASRESALQNTTQRRATAQLIALASNLDPKSKGPRNLAKAFAKGREDDFIPTLELEEPLQNITTTSLFLLEDPNNPEHRAIAQLLLDPLAAIAPELDVVSTRPNSEESPRWHQVVAPIEHFVTRRAPAPEIVPGEAMNEEQDDEIEPATLELSKNISPFNGSITVPVFVGTRTRSATLSSEGKLLNLTFEARLKKEHGRIYPPVSQGAQTLAAIVATVRSNLTRRHGEQVVAHTDGKFRLGSSNYLDRNGQSLTLPMTLLGEAFLSERQLVDDLIVLGTATPEGQLKAPQSAWQFLKILLASESKETRRLLVTPDLAPLLETFLTQQNEDFFFDYDIFVVRTLAEAIEFSFKDAVPEQTQQALAQFQEIREVGKGKKTSVFVSNAHVIARLDKVLALEPRFLSASLLKRRGNGDYPAKFSEKILAARIQSALMPLARIPYTPSRSLAADTLEKAHSDSRAGLDAFERYVPLANQDLYKDSLDLANRVRTLARAKERFDKAQFNSEDSFHVSLFYNTFRAIQEDHFELAQKTAQILGQKPPLNPRDFDTE